VDGGNACIPDAGAVCNTLGNYGPLVEPTSSSGTAPTMTGGTTIQPGLYYLTSQTEYGGDAQNFSDGYVVQQAIQITAGDAGTYLAQQVSYNSSDGCSRATLTLSFSSPTVTATQTCGNAFATNDGGNQGGSAQYTVTSTTFTIEMTGGDGTEVTQTFTLQP
jgi:hypothetical protein